MAPSDEPSELRRGSGAETIARQLRTDIEAGRYTHGQQLPSVAVLAQEWNTSTGTATRAIAMLADDGLVVRQQGKGTLVNRPGATDDVAAPVVILVGGYAGSGKTELGRILARMSGWPIVDKDTTTRSVVEAALVRLGSQPSDRESDTYRTYVRPAEYEALMATMRENVECGVSVIVTAPFISELNDAAWCERMSATVKAMGAELRVVWVHADAESMSTYLNRRGAARDAWKLAHWDQYLTSVDLDFTPAIRHWIVQNSVTSPPLQQQAAQLLSRVRQ